MRNLWDKIRYSEWFWIAVQVILVLVFFIVLLVVGTLIKVWYTNFMQNIFNIKVYWTN